MKFHISSFVAIFCLVCFCLPAISQDAKAKEDKQEKVVDKNQPVSDQAKPQEEANPQEPVDKNVEAEDRQTSDNALNELNQGIEPSPTKLDPSILNEKKNPFQSSEYRTIKAELEFPPNPAADAIFTAFNYITIAALVAMVVFVGIWLVQNKERLFGESEDKYGFSETQKEESSEPEKKSRATESKKTKSTTKKKTRKADSQKSSAASDTERDEEKPFGEPKDDGSKKEEESSSDEPEGNGSKKEAAMPSDETKDNGSKVEEQNASAEKALSNSKKTSSKKQPNKSASTSKSKKSSTSSTQKSQTSTTKRKKKSPKNSPGSTKPKNSDEESSEG